MTQLQALIDALRKLAVDLKYEHAQTCFEAARQLEAVERASGFACPHCGYRHPPDGGCV